MLKIESVRQSCVLSRHDCDVERFVKTKNRKKEKTEVDYLPIGL